MYASILRYRDLPILLWSIRKVGHCCAFESFKYFLLEQQQVKVTWKHK